jgi:hypothetical protein
MAPAGGMGDAWVNKMHYQRLEQTGALQGLFEVDRSAARTQTLSPEFEKAMMMEHFNAVARAVRAAERQAAAAVEEQSRYSGDTWLRRTRWIVHLHGLDKSWLASLIEKPDPDRHPKAGVQKEEENETQKQKRNKRALAKAWLAVDRLI